MTTAPPDYDPDQCHTKEFVYSTPLSTLLGLHRGNRYIHSLKSLPLPLEWLVFLLGYAFNPVVIPFWLGWIAWIGAKPDETRLRTMLMMQSDANETTRPTDDDLQRLVFPPIFYLSTVLITVAGTELLKALFQASRPETVLSKDFLRSTLRPYGKRVASLKSKHSFPSGDSAQAANMVLFLSRYVWDQYSITTNATLPIFTALLQVLVLAFYPGVAFARVYYHCHWIEDTIGGGLLALGLHHFIVPQMSVTIWQLLEMHAPSVVATAVAIIWGRQRSVVEEL